MIVAEDINMKYRQVLKEIVALKNISLEVKEGEIFDWSGWGREKHVISNFDNPSSAYRREGYSRGI